MSDEKALTTQAPSQETAIAPFSAGGFEMAQRQATALSQSDFVPQAFKGKVANCLVALEIAHRTGSSPMAVMQNLNVIHGKPTWSAQYIIGVINSCGRFEKLCYTIREKGEVEAGSKKVKNLECFAYATEKKTGEVVKGPLISIEMAIKEGWYTKAGSKWPSMPELMLQYRAATFFGRLYCADLLLGMKSEDEARDVGPASQSGVSAMNEKLREQEIVIK